MNSDPESRFEAPFEASGTTLTRLNRLSKIAVVASFVSALVIAGWLVALWVEPGLIETKMAELSAAPALNPLTSDRIILGGIIVMLTPVILVLELIEVGRLFMLFATGRVFDHKVPVRLRRLGSMTMALALVGVVTRTAMTLVVTSVNPPGTRQLTLGIGSDELLALVAGFLFFALSLVMAEALRLARENESFV